MPASQLLQLAKDGNLEQFEARCLEWLGTGHISLSELVPPFEQLARLPGSPRIAALGQMVLENTDPATAPTAALRVARVTLLSDPDNATLREQVTRLYRQAFGHVDGFDTVLEQSGLGGTRPARNALRVLDFCLSLTPGMVLMSRTEDVVVEVADVDHARGLYTVRRNGRPTTLPTVEVARLYEAVDPDDFRVLRELRPDRIAELISNDPVTLVIGLIRSHGEWIDQDTLKNELVPRHIRDAEWAKWWTKARAQLKKSPNIVLEGRSPLILKFSARGQSLEDDTWQAVAARSDAEHWLDATLGYLREKRANKAEPDAGLIERIRNHILTYAGNIAARRPGEALACVLAAAEIDDQAGTGDTRARAAAGELLKNAPDAGVLIASLGDSTLWEIAIDVLGAARPADAPQTVARLLPVAPAALLDLIAGLCRKHGLLERVQEQIDAAIANPVAAPETLYWLWKGSKETADLRIPRDLEQFSLLISTLSALGRTLNPPDSVMKRFRQRIKSALGLKDFARSQACLKEVDGPRAITLRQQLTRLDGLGDNTPARLVEMLRELHPDLWRGAVERRAEAWADPNVLWTTRKGLERKTEERDHLLNVTMRENAKRIGEAAALGDLSENAEYKFALEERDLLRARLAQMNQDLSLAQGIEPLDVPTDLVGVGSRVKLRRVSDGVVKELTFLGPFDTDVDEGVLNYRAPVSQKLMGLRLGEQATIMLDGHESAFEVVEITNGLMVRP